MGKGAAYVFSEDDVDGLEGQHGYIKGLWLVQLVV